MSFLLINNIHHTYFSKSSATTALENINLAIKEGEFISFIGPSGCGKTTLLSIIAGLLQPTKGDVLLKDTKVTASTHTVGYMLQQDYLFPWRTIEENILLGLKLNHKLCDRTKEKAIQLLQEIGLEGTENLYPRQLSGGMRQRAALVRTLVTDPQIFLLDEPFSALDFQTKLKLEDLVSNTLKEYNKTTLLVTHDIGEAIAMSDRIILLDANPGRISETFVIPNTLSELPPFNARQHPIYADLFQKVWKELDKFDTSNKI
ncbi:ABC transporter ATP-binding protein [Cytobacillus sp. IB215665]|uniref:ABC transporter ATP-binding protein n=1 Tax=Cytobacillus sp. IB215665 TaxID=3097357 RepID=UPI002A1359BE|nr:ABC transporter ATP-binding protein [Cytobacillus sp. IB215665]MDX8367442.1 ABC transporter ATP-binding protein [Cytobacillus sp. IB215665]